MFTLQENAGLTVFSGYLNSLKLFTASIQVNISLRPSLPVPTPDVVWNVVASNLTKQAVITMMINNPFQNVSTPEYQNIFKKVELFCVKDCGVLGLPIYNEDIEDRLIYCCSPDDIKDNEDFKSLLPDLDKYQKFDPG